MGTPDSSHCRKKKSFPSQRNYLGIFPQYFIMEAWNSKGTKILVAHFAARILAQVVFSLFCSPIRETGMFSRWWHFNETCRLGTKSYCKNVPIAHIEISSAPEPSHYRECKSVLQKEKKGIRMEGPSLCFTLLAFSITPSGKIWFLNMSLMNQVLAQHIPMFCTVKKGIMSIVVITIC